MGRHLLSFKQSPVQFQHNNPGCMWGIFHILDYHHWHNVKKVFPLRKHYWGRHAKHARKTILYDHGIGEDQQFGTAESEPLLVKQEKENVSAIGKRSPRRRKKESHTENKTKEENSKGWNLNSHDEPQHLGSPKKSFQYKENDTINARQNHSEYGLYREKDGKTTEDALNRDIISNTLNDHIDVLEVFRVEKDLLLKLLRDLDIGEKDFRHVSNNKVRLTKSGSFPLASSSKTRNIGSTTLNHKKNEVWAFPKSETSLTATQAQKRFTFSFAKFTSHTKEMPIVTDHDADRGSKAKPSVSSSGSSHGFYQKGWNQLVLHRFKAIKQKIKHALVEFTKNGYLTSIEAIHQGASSDYRLPSKNMKKVSQSLEETKASDYDSHNKHEASLMRRTCSINESLDKYTQLFEQSFCKDMKWHNSMSKSLKLIDEDTNEMSVQAPKSSRRNLSLPNLDPLGFLLHEAIRDTSDIGIPGRTSVENNTNAEIHIHLQKNPTKSEIQEVVVSSGNDVNPKTMDNYEKEVISDDNRDDRYEAPMGDGKDVLVVLETSCENYATREREDMETITKDSGVDELDTNVNATAEGANKSGIGNDSDNHLLLFKSDTENDINFKYVKNVIEFSGLLEENEGHTDTIEQPLKLSIFKEFETYLHREMEFSREEIISKGLYEYDHQLLFNLVNEVLLQIYERSSTYFPRPFSFNLSLHPKPKGRHLLRQIWNRVELYLRLKPELDQTLEDVVSRDLAQSGWMNLQWEEECVALEVEDMIVEDLLHEVLFS